MSLWTRKYKIVKFVSNSVHSTIASILPTFFIAYELLKQNTFSKFVILFVIPLLKLINVFTQDGNSSVLKFII